MKKKKTIKTAADFSQKQKINFFSAMMIVVGSCIGAGIFFKSKAVLSNANGSLILALISWAIAAFAVIAMALALIEIVSATKKDDDLSFIGWNKLFNSVWIFKASKNFMLYIYLPLNFFYMPLYFIQTIQDAIWNFSEGNNSSVLLGFSHEWIVWIIIAFGIGMWFLFTGLKAKISDWQNKIILVFKFFPLVFAALIGFILIATGVQSSAQAGISVNIEAGLTQGASLASLTPGLGMFIGIAGIFFAYDGFYVSAGIQSEMKEPERTPKAILYGLGIVTVVYVIIAISMSIVGNGSIGGLEEQLQSAGMSAKASFIFMGVINLLVAIGILGIINGFAVWTPRYMEDLIAANEIPFINKKKWKLNKHLPLSGLKITLILTLPLFVIFAIIGALGYTDSSGYAFYGAQMDNLYSLADDLSNWTSVIVFGFIAIAIYGAIRNRKTQKVKVTKNKFLIPFGIVSIILVGLSMSITVIIPIIDLFLLTAVQNTFLTNELVVGKFIKVFILFIFILVMFVPTIIENYFSKKTKLATAEI
ncbi:amino acid transporter [Mycoplasma testudineum]|uniref:Amino acid transporter n=1 Tax=Mycoplasma testudineum TaxID=244584 RepID=A0A4R6IH95_9MOLU|nr:APC family permease [Mycoplasma testudineum]TDO20415.1 amino acid transporter [Mycoplasma testudineum]